MLTVHDHNQFLARALASVGDGIIVTDSVGHVAFVNDEAARLTGWKIEEVLGRRLREAFEIVDEQTNRIFKAPAEEVLRSARVIRFTHEGAFDGGGGGHRALQGCASPVRAVSGELTGVVFVFREACAGRPGDDKVSGIQRDWERTFDTMPDLVSIHDKQHRFMRVNRVLAERVGKPPEECIGQHCYRLVHGLNAPPPFCPHTLACRDGQIHKAGFHEKHLDCDLLVTVKPLLDADGEVIGSVHVARDISELKRVEAMLRENEADLNRAQAIARVGSWRLDVRKNELRWSEEVYRIFGMPRTTPVSYAAFLNSVHAEDREYVDKHWQAALQGEPYDIEHRIVTELGVKWVRELAELEFSSDGVLLGGFGTVQDVTELKEARQALNENEELRGAEQRIRELNDQLACRVEDMAAANAELETFSYSVSHDLRAPLRQIEGFTDFLRRAAGHRLDAESAEYLELIRRAVSRMGRLIDALLAFSRAGRVELKRLTVDFNTLLDQWPLCVPRSRKTASVARAIWREPLCKAAWQP